MNYQLILGSNSPRRAELLESLGFQFEIVSKSVNEDYPDDLAPLLVAEFLAKKKATAFTPEQNQLVITADTVVIANEVVLGKPKDSEEAIKILNTLSGAEHQVVTGVCLKTNEREIVFREITKVTFGHLTQDEIEHYVATCQPFDKAGAYGIQEWIGKIGIQSIEGDYYNVMGLPLHQLWQRLKVFK